MNEPLEVWRFRAGFEEKGIRKPDILMRGANGAKGFSGVAFEYDSPDHVTPAGVLSDTLRDNELKAMGLKEYRINAALYRDVNCHPKRTSRVFEWRAAVILPESATEVP